MQKGAGLKAFSRVFLEVRGSEDWVPAARSRPDQAGGSGWKAEKLMV